MPLAPSTGWTEAQQYYSKRWTLGVSCFNLLLSNVYFLKPGDGIALTSLAARQEEHLVFKNE